MEWSKLAAWMQEQNTQSTAANYDFCDCRRHKRESTCQQPELTWNYGKYHYYFTLKQLHRIALFSARSSSSSVLFVWFCESLSALVVVAFVVGWALKTCQSSCTSFEGGETWERGGFVEAKQKSLTFSLHSFTELHFSSLARFFFATENIYQLLYSLFFFLKLSPHLRGWKISYDFFFSPLILSHSFAHTSFSHVCGWFSIFLLSVIFFL